MKETEDKVKPEAELIIANKELAFQNGEKDKRAAELIIANKELAFQNEEKDKRAAELIIANKELAFQNEEKDKRAAELIIANIELAFQSEEKEKRAAELIIANKELAFQSEEKEKRAAELIIANKELAFQNKEKKRRAIQTDELKEQNLELEIQKKQLDEASQLKSAFLSNMSHELRTPLNAIVGFSELALKTKLTSQQHNYLSKIKISSHALLGLISEILDLSKIEAGKLELEIAPFSLEDVLQEAVSQVGVKSHEKGLKIVVSINGNVPISLEGDALRLGQILTNLVSNAVKFTDKGEIVIRAELLENDGESASLQFSVKDTGIGLTLKQIEILFQPFTQADTSTTRKYGGTGLGLSISQKLVHMMNGDIWVESELGVGSTFFFTAKMHVADEGADNERLNQYRNTFAKWDMKVLIVDDKEDSREIIGHMLAEMSLGVTMSTTGEEAITLVEKSKEEKLFDVVIMDWKMPGMNGIETSKRIKKLFTADKAPAIILLTAFSNEGLQEKAEQIGLLEAVLYKPVVPSLLFNAIIHVCGKEALAQVCAESKTQNDAGYLPELRDIRVLLVEDNEINWEVAKEILQEAGLVVTIANNGREAVDQVQANTYDVVLMDIQMPIMDGYAATRELRRDPAFSELPIIAMTANALPSDRKKCLQAGMNDYVAKPIDTSQLLRSIAHLVRKEQGVKGETEPCSDGPRALTSDSFSKSAETMPYLAGIDVQTGLSRLGGNKNLYCRLLMKFHKIHEHTINDIRFALDRYDYGTAEILAHTLKGSAGNIGAQEIYLAAGTLEAELKAHRVDGVEPFLNQLEQALVAAFASISLMKMNDEDISGSHECEASISLLMPILDQLQILLRDNNMDAVECANDVVRKTKNTVFAEKAGKLKGYVDQYNFEGALVIFNDILHNVVKADEYYDFK